MKKLIGSSPEMERLREDILDLGQADSHVLIDGETGTGKTLVAHALHAVGPRATKKFITSPAPPGPRSSCPQSSSAPIRDDALPLVEEARGGTLCLEDIEALPNAIQARLLTFINEQGTRPRPASSRSATNTPPARRWRIRSGRTCSSGSRR
jgi:DNA-binding NtrC family response regulator